MPLRRLLLAAFLTYRRYACEICNSHPTQIHLVILHANYAVLPPRFSPAKPSISLLELTKNPLVLSPLPFSDTPWAYLKNSRRLRLGVFRDFSIGKFARAAVSSFFSCTQKSRADFPPELVFVEIFLRNPRAVLVAQAADAFPCLIAIVIVVVCGILISYLSVRKRSALTSVLDVLTMFPYIIPGSVLGISFLYAFNGPPFMLGGTVLIIVISLSIRRMPYTIRSSTAIIGQISPSVEEASVSLGASQLKTFLRVTIPMMLPGVLSGAIMSWITLISELSSSVILYTSKTMTLTVAIYSEVIRSNFGNAAAYSTILTLTSIVSLLLFFKLSGRKDLSV